MLPIIMNFQRKQQLGPATSYALQIVVAKGEKVLGRRENFVSFSLLDSVV